MARISQSQLAKLFRRLATSYSAGLDIRSILDKETETGNTTYRYHSRQIADAVAGGDSLAEAMEETDGYFPELAVSVIRAGERGGRLEESFAKLADHYQNLVSFRNRLLASLAWPLFELGIAILVVALLMGLCDFIFRQVDKPPINWLLMGSTTGNIVAYFVLIAGLLTGIWLVIRGTSLGWFGDTPMKIARRIPVIGKTIEYLALSRFAWTLAVAENAGMSPNEIAQLALDSTENYYYVQHKPDVDQMLTDGKSFYQTFKSTDAFPQELLNFIDNGEVAGELAESMDRASAEYQRRADVNLKVIGTFGFAATICFVAVLVLIIVIFAMSQYLNLLNDMTRI